MSSESNSSVKTRRSFSSHDPPTTLMPPLKSSLRQTIRRLIAIPPTISEQQQQKQQFLDDLKSGAIKDTSTNLTTTTTTTDSGGDVVSISEFSIAPKTATASSGFLKKRRSFSLNESSDGSTSSVVGSAPDHNLSQYISETNKWRAMRTQLKLPPEVRLKLESRKPFSFKSVALGVLDEVHVKNEGKNISYISRPPSRTKIEPTYQLGPKKHCNQVEVEKIVRDIVSVFIGNLEAASNSETTMAMVQQSADHLTTLIKARVKLIVDKRYKIVVYSIVIDKRYQGVMVASKCIWDTQNDVCVTVREDFKNYSIIINLYAVYHE